MHYEILAAASSGYGSSAHLLGCAVAAVIGAVIITVLTGGRGRKTT